MPEVWVAQVVKAGDQVRAQAFLCWISVHRNRFFMNDFLS
jgi:hypothetical protein